MSESEYSDQDYESSGDDQDSRQKNRDRTRRLERTKPPPPPSTNGRSPEPNRSVYVCNVPFNYEWQDLKDLFRNEVGKVTFVEPIKEGSFFIEFSTNEMAAEAVKSMHRYEINGRNIVVKKHSDAPSNNKGNSRVGGGGGGGGRSNRSSGGGGGSGSGGGSGRSVYVCNIPYDCKAHGLKALFRKEVGDVVGVDFVKEGCAFVEFRSSDSVKRAVDGMNRYEINGRKIVVKEDAPSNMRHTMHLQPQNYSSLGLPSLGRSGLMGEPNFSAQSLGGFGGSRLGGAYSDSSSMSGGHQSLLGPVPERHPFGARPSMSSGYGGSASNESYGRSLSSGLTSSGFSSSSARSSQSLMAEPFPDSSRMTGRPSKIGNTFGLSLDFLESKGINGPLVKKVFVANIDYKVDEEAMKELFSIAGTVTDVELKKDDDGKSRGYGFVELEHPVEAVQAISMLHEQVYYDRKLSVQMAKASQFEEIAGRRKEDKKERQLPRGLQSLGMGLGMGGGAMKDISIARETNLPSY